MFDLFEESFKALFFWTLQRTSRRRSSDVIGDVGDAFSFFF
jgi:hypothetical protein